MTETEAAEFTEVSDAMRALDGAGVPTGEGGRSYTLAERIRLLAARSPIVLPTLPAGAEDRLAAAIREYLGDRLRPTNPIGQVTTIKPVTYRRILDAVTAPTSALPYEVGRHIHGWKGR